MLPYKKGLRSRSRELRSSMTEAEIALWAKLRRKQLFGLQFYRQKTLGNFIVDFYCASARLVIEVDGGQHYEKEGAAQDAARDRYLKSLGLEVLRFSNRDVLRNTDAVIAAVAQHLDAALGQKNTKSPRPPIVEKSTRNIVRFFIRVTPRFYAQNRLSLISIIKEERLLLILHIADNQVFTYPESDRTGCSNLSHGISGNMKTGIESAASEI
jgi:very-short-patch-repair endonuclease